MRPPGPQLADKSAACGEDLAKLGPALQVPFVVRRLQRPAIVWLNHRWFWRIGWDLTDPAILLHVRESMLRDFSFAAPADCDPSDAFTTETAVFHADRYGASHGEWHGGSGRCGSNGRIHAKGIGKTPLASSNANATHSNGMMLLWEAMLEAISSEIADEELPGGAIPVIAIIDMGFASDTPFGRTRRALMLRPNFIRPSHFERSIFFGSAGTSQSDQFMDSLRVRDAFSALPHLRSIAPEEVTGFFEQMFLANAGQVGAAHAHRLWLGTYSSGNRSIDGALADFGAFRSVPDWRAHATRDPEVFGGELASLFAAIDAISFYLSKYSRSAPPLDRSAVKRGVQSECARGFRRACAAALGIAGEGEAASVALDLLRDRFDFQQRQRVEASGASGHASGGNSRQRRTGANQETRRFVTAALASLKADAPGERALHARRNALLRWLHPRRAMFQDVVIAKLSDFAASVDWEHVHAARKVAAFIDLTISRSRRLWQGAPNEVAVGGQWVRGASAGLIAEASGGTEPRLFLRGKIAAEVAAVAQSIARSGDRDRMTESSFLCVDRDGWEALRSSRPQLARNLRISLDEAYYYPKRSQ